MSGRDLGYALFLGLTVWLAILAIACGCLMG